MAAAATAAACFDAGLALQALAARREPPAERLHVSLLGRLARRRSWLLATGLAAAGWPFHLLALSLAPLSLVQPTLALGLVLLLVLGGRVLREAVGVREWGAVATIVAAMGLLAWAAPPERSDHAGPAALAAGLVPLAAVAALPFLHRRGRVPAGATLALAAGAAYAWTGVSSKLLVDDLSKGVVVGVLLWAVGTAALALAGLVSEMSALQRTPATQVGPMVFGVQTSIPVMLAPLLGGESWGETPLHGVVIVLAVALVAAAAAVLARSPAVAAWAGQLQHEPG